MTRPRPTGPPPSPEEFDALGVIARHRVVPRSMCRRLQTIGLIEHKSGSFRHRACSHYRVARIKR